MGDVTLGHLQLGPLTPQGKLGVQAELCNAGAWGIVDTPEEGSNPQISKDLISFSPPPSEESY